MVFLIHDGILDKVFEPFADETHSIELRKNKIERFFGFFYTRNDISDSSADLYIQFQLSPNRIKTHASTVKLLRIHDVFPITNPEWFKIRSRISFRLASRNLRDFHGFVFNSKHTNEEFKKIFQIGDKLEFNLACRVNSYLVPQKCGRCQSCKLLRGTLPRFVLSVGTL